MSKTVLGLVAALGSAAPLAGAHAVAVTEQEAHAALQVSSVAELLETPANSVAILDALEASAQKQAAESKGVQTAQIYFGFGYPHHHHHHYYYHHHHHHYYYHHHHHHHTWCYYHPYAPACY